MAQRTSIWWELWLFLRAHKAYWLAPILVGTLLLLGLLALSISTGGAIAPFIYALF